VSIELIKDLLVLGLVVFNELIDSWRILGRVVDSEVINGFSMLGRFVCIEFTMSEDARPTCVH
jgi:hypothetical protein